MPPLPKCTIATNLASVQRHVTVHAAAAQTTGQGGDPGAWKGRARGLHPPNVQKGGQGTKNKVRNSRPLLIVCNTNNRHGWILRPRGNGISNLSFHSANALMRHCAMTATAEIRICTIPNMVLCTAMLQKEIAHLILKSQLS